MVDGYYQKEERDVPFGLKDLKEEIPAEKALQYKRMKLWSQEQISGNNWLESEIIDVRLLNTWLVQLIANHASYKIDYAILAAIDPSKPYYWETLKEGTIQGSSTVEKRALGLGCTDAYGFIKVRVKSNTQGQAVPFMGFFAGKGGNIQ